MDIIGHLLFNIEEVFKIVNLMDLANKKDLIIGFKEFIKAIKKFKESLIGKIRVNRVNMRVNLIIKVIFRG